MKKIFLLILAVSLTINTLIVNTTAYAESGQGEYQFNILIEANYKNFHSDGQYIYAETMDEMLTVFDTKKNMLLETKYEYDESYGFTDGILCIKKDGLYGGIDINGNIVIDFLYTVLSKFNSGKSSAVINGKSIILDKAGNVCAEYGYVSAFINGFAFVSDKEFYNSGGSGSIIIFSQANSNSGDANYPKTSAERSGFSLIDANYKVVIDNLEADIYSKAGVPGYKPGWGVSVYYSTTSFNERGIAVAKRNGKYGLVNAKGEIIYDFTVDSWEKRGAYIICYEGSSAFAFDSNGDRYEGEIPGQYVKANYLPYGKSPRCAIVFNNDNKYLSLNSKEVVYYIKEGKSYDNKGNIIFDYPIRVSSSLNNDYYDIYKFESADSKGYGLISVNPVPRLELAVGSQYICLMQENPLINISGHVSPIEKDNYFFTPIIENNRTLVPLRVILEAMKATVDWDDATQVVTATKGDIKMQFQISKKEMYKNGTMIWLDTPARLVRNRTLVPLRAIAEGFGATVDWAEESRTITIVYQ